MSETKFGDYKLLKDGNMLSLIFGDNIIDVSQDPLMNSLMVEFIRLNLIIESQEKVRIL